jgi:hypothetical protein
VDTLVLAYKYTPATEGDIAWVNIYLKKAGDVFWSGGIFLPASDEYTRFETAIAAPDVPDSVIIEMQSGLWQDTTLNHVGSKLVVDDIHFKSEEVIPTGLPISSGKDAWSVYPNPTGGRIYFKGLDSHTGNIGITDLSGRLVYSWHGRSMPVPYSVDLSPYGKGLYFVTIGGRSIKIVVR